MLSFLPLIIVFLTGTSACAQDKSAEIDKIFSWATPETPGCVCAVSQNGKTVINKAYGMADLERNVPLTANSIFDVASLTKQFVAAAILLLAEEKQLALSDDVRKYIPELPDYGHRITLDHLLTHTSGLRDWPGIAQLSSTTSDALTLVLRQRSLDFTPGEEWSYSNSGYVLLKEIIRRITGTTFADFARKRFFEPFGMNSTLYLDDLRHLVKNRALAYEKENGRWRMDMALDNDRGGGGALFSTASDLLTWNEALNSGRLGNFVTGKLQEPATLANGRKLGYARGLYLNSSRGGRVIGHTGGSSGYGSILTRIPGQGFSIAILCNSGETGDRMAFARRIFDLVIPATDTKPAPQKNPAPDTDSVLTGVDLTSKAGLFFNERTGEPLRLLVNNGRLGIAGLGVLVPVAPDRFRNPNGSLTFMSGDEFEIQFLSSNEFNLKSMEGKVTRYRRALPYAPAAQHLRAFAGSYESREIGTVFLVGTQGESLVLRQENAPSNTLEFKPVSVDTFQWGRIMLRFHRDKSGKVTAMDFSNPVLRKVRFTRVDERSAP